MHRKRRQSTIDADYDGLFECKECRTRIGFQCLFNTHTSSILLSFRDILCYVVQVFLSNWFKGPAYTTLYVNLGSSTVYESSALIL